MNLPTIKEVVITQFIRKSFDYTQVRRHRTVGSGKYASSRDNLVQILSFITQDKNEHCEGGTEEASFSISHGSASLKLRPFFLKKSSLFFEKISRA